MKLNITFDWTQTNVIPPRCRNPRSVHHKALTMEADLKTTTAEQAPVAIRYASVWDVEHQLHWFDGRLWERYRPASGQTEDTILGSALFPMEPILTGWRSEVPSTERLDEAEAAIRKHYDDFLAIDSVIYRPAAEPHYRISEVSRGTLSKFLQIDDNSRSRDGRSYSALDLDLAKADLQSILDLSPRNRVEEEQALGHLIEVLVPEAVQFQTTTYSEAVGEEGMKWLESLVVKAQGDQADDDTPELVAKALEAMIALDGWAMTHRHLTRAYSGREEAEERMHAALVKAGVATDAPTIVRTTYVFEVLHRADEPLADIHDAVNEAEGGHAVGMTLSERTEAVADLLVPAALKRLGNDGEFFAIDLDAEAYED